MLPFAPSRLVALTLLIAGFTLSPPSASSQEESEFRKFTSTDGKSIEAKPIALSSDTLEIKMRNGKTFDLPVARLSPEDQKWIVEWKKKRAENFVPNLKISFDENMEKSNDETGFVHVEKFSPELEITNQESTFELSGAKATMLLIVENVKEGDVFLVLSKETIPLSLAAGESKKLNGKKAETMYATIQAYGGKYAGYAVIIQNASGNIIAHAGSRGWEKNSENALKVNEGSTVLKDFKVP